MSQIRFRENRLNGLFPLSYMGVIPVSPSNFIQSTSVPMPYDSKNFYIGDFWLNISSDVGSDGTPPTINDLYILVSLDKGIATWIPIGGGSGTVITLTGNTGGAVGPTAGNINVIGDGSTISIAGNPGTSTLTAQVIGAYADTFNGDTGSAVPLLNILVIQTGQASLNSGSSILFAASGHTVQLNVTDSSDNTLIGKSSGNLSLTGNNNTGLGESSLHAVTSSQLSTAIGSLALPAVTSGNNNTSVGASSGLLLSTGSDNTIIGSQAGNNLLTGNDNILIGQSAGSAYSGSESSNIIITTNPTYPSAGDNNVIRIGCPGSGADTQSSCFIAGITGVNVGSTAQVVTMGASATANKLGTAVLTAGTGITITPTANTVTISASGSPAPTNSFFAYLNSSISGFGTVSSFVTVPNTSTLFTDGGGYNTGTSEFTAPTTGYYQFSSTISASSITSGTTEFTGLFLVTGASSGSYLFININAYAAQAVQSGTPSQNGISVTQSLFIFMNATDTILVKLLLGPSGASTVTLNGLDTGQYRTTFSGYQVA